MDASSQSFDSESVSEIQPISREILHKLSLLSRLPELADGKETADLLDGMNSVLKLFELLQAEDLREFEPLQGAPGEEFRQFQRRDETLSLDPAPLLACAPDLEGRGFVVPSVMGS